MYAVRILTDKPFRFILTLSGIALCIILILFILGVYNGVAEGSIEYIKKTPADIWVLHGNSNNIIRGTSILPAEYGDVIEKEPLIKSVSSVLLFLTNIVVNNDSATVLLAGYTPEEAGGPPYIIEGRDLHSNDEIILDRSFAKKHHLKLGSKVKIQKDTLHVVGISTGTNAFVTQYAFVTLEYEQSIIDLPGLVSYFIIKAKHSRDIPQIMKIIDKKFDGTLSLFTQPVFVINNIREMEAGILPLFSAIAMIGAVVLTIILSLILSVNILEKRRDFAIMKILGSPQWFIDKTVVYQALIISGVSLFFGMLIYIPLLRFIEYISPEVNVPLSYNHMLWVTVITFVISLFSALLACKKTRSIYPLEVFQ